MLLKQIKRWLPWCWLAFCMGSFLLFFHQNMLVLLEADMASEMVLGSHIANSGKCVPDDWYYSSELRLINPPLFYAPFFLFTDSWHLVRLLGTTAMYLFFLASFYYLCVQLRVQKWFPVAASAFFLPLSDIYAYVILIGTYYLPYACYTFWILGLVIHYSGASGKRMKVFLLLMTAALSVLSGMTGLRMLLMLFFPLFVSATFMRFANFDVSHSQKKLWTAILTATVCACTGYLLNSKLLSRFYTFAQYEDIIFTNIQFSTLSELLNHFLNHLGYRSGGQLFSSALLRILLCMLLVVLIILALYQCKNRIQTASFSWAERLPVLTYGLGIFMFAFLVSATSTPYASNYLIPAMILTPVTVLLVFVNWRWSSTVRRALACVLMLLLLFCGVDTCRTYSRGEDSRELQQISASLVQDGYTEGYSTFWRGNLVTELSDGKLDMRVWDTSDHMDITSVNPFLQLKSHETTVPQGKTFIILSKYFNEHTDIALATWLQPEDIYWVSKDYLVYGYESYDDLLHRVNQSCTSKLRNRKVEPSSAASLSPIPLYPGSYTVSITGEQLDGLQVACTHTEGTLTPSQITCASGTLTFRLDTADLLHDLQIDLQNDGTQSAVLESFHLQKDSGR